jgi:ribosomal protein S12 methylthiotransferase accessory factor
MPDTIAYRTGTYRAARPEETWQRVRPLLPRFGITRVADITRLDDIGFPVHVAYRPASLTYAVSTGTGAEVAQSRVSAVMESIEIWHAENLRLPVAARAPAAALGLGYDVRALNLASRSPLTPDVVLDWVSGDGLLSGGEILAPVDSVRLDTTVPQGWSTVFLWADSTGLATGVTTADATLHGLHEVIERASVSAYKRSPSSSRRYVDPGTCQDPVVAAICGALRAAGCTVTVCDITGPVDVPCFAATIWSPDVPMRCAGYGCHVDRELALGRALAEAVSTRLAVISGARDDIDFGAYREMTRPARPPELAAVGEGGDRAGGGGLHAAVRHCASLVAAVTGVEPVAIRLDHEDIGIPAVKVLAPGLGRAYARPMASP